MLLSILDDYQGVALCMSGLVPRWRAALSRLPSSVIPSADEDAVLRALSPIQAVAAMARAHTPFPKSRRRPSSHLKLLITTGKCGNALSTCPR